MKGKGSANADKVIMDHRRYGRPSGQPSSDCLAMIAGQEKGTAGAAQFVDRLIRSDREAKLRQIREDMKQK